MHPPVQGTLMCLHLPTAASVHSLLVAVADLNPRGPLLQSALLEKSHCPACGAALGDRELSGPTDPDVLGLGEPVWTAGSAAVSRPIGAAARLLPCSTPPPELRAVAARVLPSVVWTVLAASPDPEPRRERNSGRRGPTGHPEFTTASTTSELKGLMQRNYNFQ